MTYCVTPGIGPCCCTKLRVRWCRACQAWVCRTTWKEHQTLAHYIYGTYRATFRDEYLDEFLARYRANMYHYAKPHPPTMTPLFWTNMYRSAIGMYLDLLARKTTLETRQE